MEHPLQPYSITLPFFRPYFSLGVFLLCLWGAGHIESAELSSSLQLSHTSRVVAVSDPFAVERFSPKPAIVDQMFNQLMLAYAQKDNLAEAWSLFVNQSDVVGIKVLSDPGSVSGTRPAVVEAIIRSLISTGFPQDQIIIWDRRKGVLVATGYDQIAKRLGVSIAGSSDFGYRKEIFYEAALVWNLVFGDHEFGEECKGVGRKSFVSNLLSHKLTKIIPVHPMLNHYLGGVNGQVVGLATGGVDNSLRFTLDGNRYHQAIPEICAMPEIYDKLAFCVVDALICQYQGEERGFLQYSSIMSELRMSSDPVALDVLSLLEINRHRKRAGLEENLSAIHLYQNANLLELGESDPSKILFERTRH